MIELAEIISSLREELTSAVAAAPEDGLRFEMGPIKLEVEVAVERTADASAKVRFYVLDLGSEGSIAKAQKQRITLTLNPQFGKDQRSPFVAGAEAAAER